MFTLILFMVFCTVGLIGYSIIPTLYNRTVIVSEKRQQKLSTTIEQVLPRQEAIKMSRLFLLAPILFAGIFYYLFPEGLQTVGIAVGIIAGFVFPGFYVKFLAKRNKNKFNDQLVDALMIMSITFIFFRNAL